MLITLRDSWKQAKTPTERGEIWSDFFVLTLSIFNYRMVNCTSSGVNISWIEPIHE